MVALGVVAVVALGVVAVVTLGVVGVVVAVRVESQQVL